MARLRNRDLRATQSLKARVKALAHQQHQSPSSIVSDIVTRYVEGRLEVTLPPEDAPARIRFGVSDPTWEAALQKSGQAGESLSEIIRVALDNETRGL